MTESLREYFGEEWERAIHKVLSKNLCAIHFLENFPAIQNYLSSESSQEEEKKILLLRAEIPWFDYAILKLQDMEFLENYDKNTQEKAQYYLDMYHKAKIASPCVGKSIQKYIEDNPLVQAFCDIWKQGIAPACPIPSCSQVYSMGSTYQEISLTIPIPEESSSSIRKNLQLKFKILFQWMERKKFIEDKFWGKVEIATPSDKEECFTSEQKKQFFSLMYVDLKMQTPSGMVDVLDNLKCNSFGEFEMESRQKEIQKALDTNSLRCFLKLLCS